MNTATVRLIQQLRADKAALMVAVSRILSDARCDGERDFSKAMNTDLGRVLNEAQVTLRRIAYKAEDEA